MKRLKLFAIPLAMIMVVNSSCRSFTYLDQPVASNIPNSLKKGDKLKVIFTDGHITGKMTVDSVWSDSIRLTSDAKAIPISAIREIQVLRLDPVLTTIVIVVPVALLVVLIVDFSENPLGLYP